MFEIIKYSRTKKTRNGSTEEQKNVFKVMTASNNAWKKGEKDALGKREKK